MTEQNIWEKIGNIPFRLMVIVVFILFIIPMIRPFGLPAPIPDSARDFHTIIEELPEASLVAFSADSTGSGWDELRDATIATMRQLFMNDVKVVFYSILPGNVPCMLEALEIANPDKYNKEYGTDYVYLGYISGEETAEATIARDTWSATTKDNYGNKIEDLPLMLEFRNAEDVDLLIVYFGSVHSHLKHVRQWFVPFNTLMIAATPAGNEGGIAMYYPDTFKGYLAGPSGGAAMELLIGVPGGASKINDLKSLVFIPAILLVILRNISYYGNKYFGRTEEKSE
jgi:hypothetical protein